MRLPGFVFKAFHIKSVLWKCSYFHREFQNSSLTKHITAALPQNRLHPSSLNLGLHYRLIFWLQHSKQGVINLTIFYEWHHILLCFFWPVMFMLNFLSLSEMLESIRIRNPPWFSPSESNFFVCHMVRWTYIKDPRFYETLGSCNLSVTGISTKCIRKTY